MSVSNFDLSSDVRTNVRREYLDVRFEDLGEFFLLDIWTYVSFSGFI